MPTGAGVVFEEIGSELLEHLLLGQHSVDKHRVVVVEQLFCVGTENEVNNNENVVILLGQNQ